MTILSKPLNIGASDLLRGVDYSYCGEIHFKNDIVFWFWRKWKLRYVIISQGCFYIYTHRNAQKTEYSFSLKPFECAVECGPDSGENICFCLRYKSAQTPLLFSCDTLERRQIWIEKFSSEISDVQSEFYNVSADSGFGSAGTVPRNRLKLHHGKEEPARYDEIDERNIEEATCSPVQAHDIPCPLSAAMSTDRDKFYENLKTKYTDTYQTDRQTQLRVQAGEKSKAFTEELKLEIGKRKSVNSSMAEKGPLQTRKSSGFQLSLPAHSLAPSLSCTESSFVSVRDVTEELSHLSVRRQENLYENDTDGSNNSDDTQRKTIYENTEEFESMRSFERYEYFCDRKEKVKRLLKRMTDGVFAIFPGESTKHELCVKTPKGLKYFLLHWQSERVSLYKSHQYVTFPSLDDLLSYYSSNYLPAEDYNIKLQGGYNSMS